jgi:hypothetical protein
MANSLVIRAPGIASISNRPKLTRDPMIRPGTKFLYDFSRPRCHPNGAIAAGSMASKTMTDLSGNDVPLVFPGSGWTANADGSIDNAASVSSATIGALGEFDMSAAEYEYVATCWFELTTGYLVTSSVRMLSLNTAGEVPSDASIWLSLGGSGRVAAAYVMGDSAGAVGSAMDLDVPHMAAAWFKPGEFLKFYFDGVLAWTVNSGIESNLTDASGQYVLLGGQPPRKTFRISLCDITASAAAEETAGYDSDAILTGEQHIVREWQFCNNLIAAAPKTEF